MHSVEGKESRRPLIILKLHVHERLANVRPLILPTNVYLYPSHTYTIESASVAWCSKMKFLGVVITPNLK